MNRINSCERAQSAPAAEVAAAGEPGAPFEPPTCVGEGPMAIGASGLVRAVGRPVRGSVAAARFSCETAASCCAACGGVRSESETGIGIRINIGIGDVIVYKFIRIVSLSYIVNRYRNRIYTIHIRK